MKLRHRKTLGFDKVYVINIPDRIDRRNRVSNELNVCGIEHQFSKDVVDGKILSRKKLLTDKIINSYFIDPVGIVTNGVYGCALSHYNTWVEFIKSGAETALIFEDDIYVPDVRELYLNQLWTIISEQLINIDDWDIFFLARQSINNRGDVVEKNIVKVYSSWNELDPKPWGAHAYVLTRKAAKYLVDDYLPIKYAVDVYLDHFSLTKKLNVYSTDSTFFHQRNAWLAYSKYHAVKDILKGFGDDDSNIVNINELRTIHKSLEVITNISHGEKVISFLTLDALNEFMETSTTEQDIINLYKDVWIEEKDGGKLWVI